MQHKLPTTRSTLGCWGVAGIGLVRKRWQGASGASVQLRQRPTALDGSKPSPPMQKCGMTVARTELPVQRNSKAPTPVRRSLRALPGLPYVCPKGAS